MRSPVPCNVLFVSHEAALLARLRNPRWTLKSLMGRLVQVHRTALLKLPQPWHPPPRPPQSSHLSSVIPTTMLEPPR